MVLTKGLLLTLKVRLEFQTESDYKKLTCRRQLGFLLKFIKNTTTSRTDDFHSQNFNSTLKHSTELNPES